jgi:hypothetical protein
MRFDYQNQLSSAQAFSSGTPTATTNCYQMQSVNQDISIGEMMSLFWSPTVAAGTGSTTTFYVITSSDNASSLNVTTIATSPGILAASLGIGYGYELPIPKGSLGQGSAAGNLGLYLAGQVAITGGTATITLDCYLMPSEDIAKFKSFPKVVDALV